MSTHNIGLYEDLTKIIFQISSNTHLIFSAGSRTSLFGRLPVQSLHSIACNCHASCLLVTRPTRVCLTICMSYLCHQTS